MEMLINIQENDITQIEHIIVMAIPMTDDKSNMETKFISDDSTQECGELNSRGDTNQINSQDTEDH